jgi:hypothetical protein
MTTVTIRPLPFTGRQTYIHYPLRSLSTQPQAVLLGYPPLQLAIRPHNLLCSPRLRRQIRASLYVLTGHPLPALPLLRAGPWHLRNIKAAILIDARPQRPQQLHGGLRRQILIIVIIDLHHRRIDTSTQTLDLQQTEHAVLGHVPTVNAELLFDGLHDLVTAAAAQHARRGGADLHEEGTDGLAVVHGIEGGDLVDAHGRHLKDAGDLVHDGDGGEAVLALAQVEKGHDGGLFVLRWVALEDLVDELEVGFVEGEGDGGVVIGCVTVLQVTIVSYAIVDCFVCFFDHASSTYD